MIAAPPKPAWIAVDWGTSNLRAWAMDAAGEVLDHAESDTGMAGLTPPNFEPALLRIIQHWLGDGTTPVIACGMVGARQGWTEAPYRAAPCLARTDAPVRITAQDTRLAVYLLPGVSQESPADVMRGEETQIAGYLAQNPNFDGILCLPGTHSKWVHVSAGEIVSFRTFMTGELFALLGSKSVLRHSVDTGDWDDDAFADALQTALSRPETLAAHLFALRAEHLLHDQAPRVGRARLSGLLIGVELAAAKPYWLGQPVVLIGPARLSQTYAAALAAQGVGPGIADASAMTRAGLTAAYTQLKATA